MGPFSMGLSCGSSTGNKFNCLNGSPAVFVFHHGNSLAGLLPAMRSWNRQASLASRPCSGSSAGWAMSYVWMTQGFQRPCLMSFIRAGEIEGPPCRHYGWEQLAADRQLESNFQESCPKTLRLPEEKLLSRSVGGRKNLHARYLQAKSTFSQTVPESSNPG